jgi:transcriptional regulator with XRE-family HTH domain
MKQSTYSSEYGHLLAELRTARVEAGVSQVQLAEALGQLQTYVSKCELGDRRLDVIELRTWVVALGGDPVAFMAGLEDRINRNAAPLDHVKTARKRSTGKGSP